MNKERTYFLQLNTWKFLPTWGNLSIKVLVALGLIYLIYTHLNRTDNVLELWNSFSVSKSPIAIGALLIAIALIPFNWLFEAKKWTILTKVFEHSTLYQSTKAVLCGLTVGILTPNRIGEYGGRIVLLTKENKIKGLVAQFVSSVSQNLVNLSIGLFFAIQFFDIVVGLGFWLKFALLSFWLIMTGLVILLYFNLSILPKLFERWKAFVVFNKLSAHSELLKDYRESTLSLTLFWSMGRFLIYLTQYVLILYFFGINESLLTMMFGVGAIYFIQSGVPLPPVLGVLARGEIALLVWGFFDYNELSVLAATYFLWVVNLIIPAMIGYVFLARINILKSFGYDSRPSSH